MAITLAQLLESFHARAERLPWEIGGYIVLLATEGVIKSPMRIVHTDVQLGEDGGVIVLGGGRISKLSEATRPLSAVLTEVLTAAGSEVPSSLQRLAELGPSDGSWDLVRFRDELEASLIPLNRDAIVRTVARFVREVLRLVEIEKEERPYTSTENVEDDLDALLSDINPNTDPAPARSSAVLLDHRATSSPPVKSEAFGTAPQTSSKPGMEAPTRKIARHSSAPRHKPSPPPPQTPARPPVSPRPAMRSPAPTTPAELSHALTNPVLEALDKQDQGTSTSGIWGSRETDHLYSSPLPKAPRMPTSIGANPILEAMQAAEKKNRVRSPTLERLAVIDESTKAAESVLGRGVGSRSSRSQNWDDGDSALPMKQSPKYLGYGLALAVLLMVSAGLYRTKDAIVGFLENMVARRAPSEKPAEPTTTAKPAIAPSAGDVILTVSPDRAQVLLSVGVSPTVVRNLPVGLAHEFVAFVASRTPKRALIPPNAAWNLTDQEGYFELAMQIDQPANDIQNPRFGTTLIPKDVGQSTGRLGSVRIVTNPQGAAVYQLIGFAPTVQITDADLGKPLELLVVRDGYQLKRLVVERRDYIEGGGKPTARVNVELVPVRQ